MSALAALLARRIREAGPLGIDEYMAAALTDPEHGYYATRDPLGTGGDFITAPEVSQIFGELIGLWCADTWARMGLPDPVILVELGPGRGTLMADMLRASRVAPDFRRALRLHLVETSPVLRRAQAAALAEAEPTWHDGIATLPHGPLLLVANEFLDALPIRQFVRTGDGWHERRVALGGDGAFAFALDVAPDTGAA
ncbi:MAG TPA: SAM-dependent methyltransferase, partial [Stellaceae bacterium]|nr:SAM-dependent methyltransferase [Stellaceae bacterium]